MLSNTWKEFEKETFKVEGEWGQTCCGLNLFLIFLYGCKFVFITCYDFKKRVYCLFLKND